jgi:hypothetical protein
MSYTSGMSALNLQMTDTVPRTEYSADQHWDLVQAVTGLDTTQTENRPAASRAFMKAWDYAFVWQTPGGYEIPVRTDMGHAVYAAGGDDYRQPASCPFASVDEALALDIPSRFSNPPQKEIDCICNEAYLRAQGNTPDLLVTGGIYHTLFSGLIDIFGWEMFLLAAGTNEKRFASIVAAYAQWIAPWFAGYAASKAPVIMSHDDICWTSGPVLHPDWYRKYIFPQYKKLWRPVLAAGKKLIFTSDGTYDMFFNDIVACGAHMLVMEPGNDMRSFAEKHGRTHGFVGNADTRVLLTGSRDEIYNEVKRCMDIGQQCPGFILAVGNHIPANTPVENALWYDECYRRLAKR